MNKFPVGFAVTIVCLSIALGAMVFVLRPKPGVETPAPTAAVAQTETPAAVSSAALTASYVASVREMISGLRVAMNPANARQTEEKLLNLTVPADQREFHLDLVLALHKLGKANDAKSIAAAQSAVLKTIDVDWLK